MDEDHIVLAAEWVLGTLDADEYRKAEALIASDPEFAAMVREWERRLGELNAMVAPIEPPSDLFDKIKAKISGVAQEEAIHLPDPGAARAASVDQAEPRATSWRSEAAPPVRVSRKENGAPSQPDQRGRVVVLTQKVRRWQEIGAAFATLAAMVTAVFITSLARPDLMPEQLRPKPKIVEVTKEVIKTVEVPAPKTPGDSRFTAVLQRDAASPAFILTVDLNDRTMTVRRVSAENPVGKSYELWLVSKQFPAPRSLGVVPPGEFTQPAQLANYQPDTIRDATFAISLEPEGGSPTGSATGPILWTGQLIETVPPPKPN
ncbi:MAG: anti-sigma factor [Xanthobacteraceae bacterium]